MPIYCPLCERLGIEATVSVLDIDPYYGNFEESGKFIPWNTGKKRDPFSEEWKRNMSLAQQGKRHTEDTKRRISESKKGTVFSEEHRRKIGESKKGASFYKTESYKERQRMDRLGKKHSDETRKKMSILQTGKKRGPYKKRDSDGSVS